jgi:DNA-binding transcriptional ArsR family regulator
MSLAETPPHNGVVYRNQASQRVLAVLLAFAGHASPRGVSDLARELGMSKNMVHRALGALTDEGYVTRDATGALYQLGPRLLALPARGNIETDIVTLARPALEQLHRLTGESVYLSIIVGPQPGDRRRHRGARQPRVAHPARPTRTAPLHQDVARAARAFARRRRDRLSHGRGAACTPPAFSRSPKRNGARGMGGHRCHPLRPLRAMAQSASRERGPMRSFPFATTRAARTRF